MPTRIAAALSLGLMLGGCGAGVHPGSPQSTRPGQSRQYRHFVWIDMFSPRSGWALGSDWTTAYRTTDGTDWKAVGRFRGVPPINDGGGGTLYSLSMRDAWYAFAVNGRQIGLYRTRDGGRHWSYGTIPFAYTAGQEGPDPLAGPFSLSFWSPRDGWLLAVPAHGLSSVPGVLYRTRDGGQSWQAIASSEPNAYTLQPSLPVGGEISFTGPKEGWLVGSYAADTPRLLFRTRDGGRNWSEISFPIAKDPLLDVEAPPVFSGKLGALPVQFLNGFAEVDLSSDGGSLWRDGMGERAPHSQISAQMDIVALRPAILAVFYSAADNDITRVQGNTFTDVGSVPARYLPPGMQVVEIDFVNAMDGWLVIEDAYGGGRPPILLRTRDGGRMWREV